MGSLLDQMLKAGLVDEKNAKKARHTLRQEDKQTPKASQAQARKAEVEAERQAQKARDQAASQARQAELDAKVRQAGQTAHATHLVATLMREGRVSGWEGPRRYYFTEGRRVECLMVNDDTARKLEQGQVAICRGDDPSAPYVVLTRGAAKQLAPQAPQRIITFWEGN